MVIDWPIPSQTFIAGEFARIWYPVQPQTCCKCGAEGHLATSCKSQCCFNCEQPGHRSDDCPWHPYVACAWLILTPPHSVLIFIIVPTFFPLRFRLPVISKLLREGSKQRKPNANKPWGNAPNARRKEKERKRKEKERDEREREERKKLERRKAERKRTAKRKNKKQERRDCDRKDGHHL